MKGNIARQWRKLLHAGRLRRISTLNAMTDGNISSEVVVETRPGSALAGVVVQVSTTYTATGASNAVTGADVFSSSLGYVKVIYPDNLDSELNTAESIKRVAKWASISSYYADALGNFSGSGSATYKGALALPFTSASGYKIKVGVGSVTNAYASNVTQSVVFTIYAIDIPADMIPRICPRLFIKETAVDSGTGLDAINRISGHEGKGVVTIILRGTFTYLDSIRAYTPRSLYELDAPAATLQTYHAFESLTAPSDVIVVGMDGSPFRAGMGFIVRFTSATAYQAILVQEDSEAPSPSDEKINI